MNYLIANWKMNHTIHQGVQFLHEFMNLQPSMKSTNVVIAPSFISLLPLAQTIQKESIPVFLCAQNMSQYKTGAYTGEVSGEMIVETGSQYVILGHSERRHIFCESNEMITQKFNLVLDYGLIPILCFGETLSVYEAKETVNFLKKQLQPFQDKMPPILAYEPVWAIGSGLTPTIDEISSVLDFTRQLFPDSSVLYGGSVNPTTIQPMIDLPSLAGFLVGGASLQAKIFYNLLQTMEKTTNG
jgi:triosephosphate isomerase